MSVASKASWKYFSWLLDLGVRYMLVYSNYCCTKLKAWYGHFCWTCNWCILENLSGTREQMLYVSMESNLTWKISITSQRSISEVDVAMIIFLHCFNTYSLRSIFREDSCTYLMPLQLQPKIHQTCILLTKYTCNALTYLCYFDILNPPSFWHFCNVLTILFHFDFNFLVKIEE